MIVNAVARETVIVLPLEIQDSPVPQASVRAGPVSALTEVMADEMYPAGFVVLYGVNPNNSW